MSTNKYTTNNDHTLVAVSNADGETPVYLWADPSTHGLVVSATISSVGIATSANQINGSQLTQIVDAGGEAVTVTGGKLDVNATASLAGVAIPISGATTAVGVGIVDGSGNQITSFGGGTQYADGAVRGTATGTIMMVDDGTNIQSASGNSSGEQIVQTKQNGTWNVTNVSGTVSLPTGASTAAKQDTGNTSLASIDGKITAVNTGAVVVSSSALPSGAATSAKQDTGNTSVASIDTKVPALGQALAAASVPVVLTASQLSTITPPAAITGFATSAKQDSLLTELQLKADLTETQPVSAASLPLPTGAATSALQTQPGVDIGDVTINNASGASAVNIQDGGNSITVDGAVTATLAAETTKVIGTVNQGTSPWVTSNATTSVVGNGAAATAQRVTLANDSTGVIATVGAVTAITNALPAGTNAIGKLAANSGVDIGDVDITSVLPGTGALNLGKAEDTAHTTGDVGVMALAVRNDNGAALAGADGDYLPMTTDSSGALRVDINGTVSTNNSTTAVLAGGAVFTGTSDESLIYNEIRISVIASHASATDGLSIQQSTDNTNWDITDTYTIPAAIAKTYSVPRQARYFRVVYTNGATLQTSFRLQTILNRLGTKASSQRPGDAYTNETDLEQEQVFLMGYNGTTWDRLRSDTTNGLDVDVTRLPALVTGSAVVGKVGIDQTTPGTTNLVALAANQSVNVAQMNGVTVTMGNGTAGTGVQRVTMASDSTANIATIGTSVTPGTAAANLGKAEDAAAVTGDTGVGVLGVRNDTLASQTSASGDYGFHALDTAGILMTAGAPRLLKGRQVTTITSSTAETTIVTAVASTFLDVYGLILTNTSATVTKVSIRDATAGGTISVLEVPPTDTRGLMLPLDSAIPQATVNNNWTATCGTSVSALEITVLYVKRV